MSRTFTASVICAMTAIGIAGCSDEGSSDQPFEGQSADQVAAKAVTATRDATSLRMAGKMSTQGHPLTVDFHVDTQKNCKGRLAMERGSADVIHTGQTTYVKGDKKFWAGAAQDSAGGDKQAEALSGRWVKVPVGDSRTTGLCDKQGFLADLDSDKSERKGMTKGDVTTVDGREAIALRKKKRRNHHHVRRDRGKAVHSQAGPGGRQEPGHRRVLGLRQAGQGDTAAGRKGRRRHQGRQVGVLNRRWPGSAARGMSRS
ncbi:hypothetical protein ACFQ3Z_42590 [Streptomyces nogalater]